MEHSQQKQSENNKQIHPSQKNNTNQKPNQFLQKQTTSITTKPPTCQFYISRKNRSCKFPSISGSRFCSAHCSDQQTKLECPYQKGMFIAESKFEKHLLICPMIKNKNQQKISMWYSQGVNLNQEQNGISENNIQAIVDVEEGQLMTVIRKIVKVFGQVFGKRGISMIESTESEKIDNLTNDHIQAQLIVETAARVGLISSDIIYLQFGAGKGILSYHLAEKVKNLCGKSSKNVLLQRQSRRYKFDKFMKENPYFQRYRCDVSDFDVRKLPQTMAHSALLTNTKLNQKKQIAELNQLKVVGVCKHMCGGALDISLRALLKTKISGCILASCCHHLCSYQNYLNNGFFEEREFGVEEIQILFKLSSWGTKSYILKSTQIKFEELVILQHSNLDTTNKVIIGRMCKRLIDLGRAEVLGCEVVRYCSDQITPENFVIISK